MRTFLAMLFLVFLLAEWGSHGLIASAGGPAADEQSVSADITHEDLCRTLIMCGDSGRRDHQTPNSSHQAAQHNALFDHLAHLDHMFESRGDPQFPDPPDIPPSRPIDPPFHPPETA